MPQQVCSPINTAKMSGRSGSIGSQSKPTSPGAFSNPSRGDRGRRDQGSEPEPRREPSSHRSEAPVRQADAEEPEREHEEQRRDAARFRRGDREEPADPERSRMIVHTTHELPVEPARDDSIGAFSRLIRRTLLPRKQPQPKPYRFKAFPTSSDW
jgi:hypothetical protein